MSDNQPTPRQVEIEEYKKELQALNEKYKLELRAEVFPAVRIIDLAPKEVTADPENVTNTETAVTGEATPTETGAEYDLEKPEETKTK